MRTSTVLIQILALGAQLASAVKSIDIKGADFINPTTTAGRFQLLGVAYQPGGSSGYDPSSGIDPLSDGDVCLRDAALMQRLGVNAIRVYNLDPNLNHDLCASIFNAVGIYMLLDVNSPLEGESINRDEPETTYTSAYLNRTFAVVEAFKGYPNTLLFFSGNEVINDDVSSKVVPPYMRAVTRDLKNYIKKNSDRQIPVGYSAADVRDILVDTWNYLQCTTTGDDSDESRVDLFALNSYSWCGDSSFTTSGYDDLVSDLSGGSVPIFFSEYGCNNVYPRVFTEVPVIYGSNMTPILSGGMVYEFSQEKSNYGLVEIDTDGSAKLLADFDTLQKQFAGLDIKTVQGLSAQNTTVTPPKCSSSLISSSKFNSNFTLPAVPSGAQSLINNGISNAPVGKIVSVTKTKVSQTVTDSKGNTIQNLAIVPLSDDQSNSPGSVDSSSTTDSAGTATPTKSAASGMQRNWAGLAVAGALLTSWFL